MTPIVLASGSPRRQDLLRVLGLTFEVLPADIDERPEPGETAEALVARLSRQKAEAAAAQRQGALVIAADTVVVLDGAILGKPRGDEENRAFVRRLAGRTHHVLTGHTLVRGDVHETTVVDTEVTMRPLDEGTIARYVASGEGLDKAGGYAIQGRGSAMVRSVSGCYFNVMGMSVATVVEVAQRLGVDLV